MSTLQTSVRQTLNTAADKLRGAEGVPTALVDDLERLAGKIEEPCVVAVVGRVKAGKSSFINALLGEDLAAVGSTKTTATINYFRYGTPADPGRPVRCHWRNGRSEDVDAAFLHDLQGNDLETLRRADGIAYLEYLLPNDVLRRVTLVDTPGTGAVVEEHQRRTDDYMRLRNALRERHDAETRRLGDTSDAVIYLIGAVARDSDRRFLEEFAQANRKGTARALNAIGVIAKIDLSPELMQRRQALTAKVADRLADSLNTVLPVSAGLRRGLDRLLENGGAGLRELIEALRALPAARRDKLLSSEDFFLDLYDERFPLERRERLRGDMDWGVFTAIARTVAKADLEAEGLRTELDAVAGFGPLREVLERHFFARGDLLRCHRLVSDALGLVNRLRYDHIPALRQRARDEAARRARFLAFVNASQGGDPEVGRELSDFIQAHAATYAEPVAAAAGEAERILARVLHELHEHNADFEALQRLEQEAGRFADAERDELRALLGLYGMAADKRLPPGKAGDAAWIGQRQRHWRNRALRERIEPRRAVLERAVEQLGLLLDEAERTNDDSEQDRVQERYGGTNDE